MIVKFLNNNTANPGKIVKAIIVKSLISVTVFNEVMKRKKFRGNYLNILVDREYVKQI